MPFPKPAQSNWLTEMTLKQHKNPLVIYHANCADGFSAAWVFHYIQDKVETLFDFHPGVYGEALPDIEDRKVYLVDFSYPLDKMMELCRKAARVILIDHHKTALDLIPDLLLHDNFVHFTDLDRSGAILAWDYWHNAVIHNQDQVMAEVKKGEPRYVNPPTLLEHIQDRDLWKFKLARTSQIHLGVTSFDYTFENWDKMMLGGVAEVIKLTQSGAAIERKYLKDIADAIKLTYRIMRIGNYAVATANVPYFMASDAGGILAKEFADGTMFSATYFDTATHRKFSLRSTERGMDVSAIAAMYQGGGHKHAAGFQVPRDHVLAMV